MSMIPARCPVCRERLKIQSEQVGLISLCPNCRQGVMAVPLSSRARFWRSAFKLVLALVLLWAAFQIYEWRVETMTGALSF